MRYLKNFIVTLLSSYQYTADQVYLSQATDLCDLEYRQKNIMRSYKGYF